MNPQAAIYQRRLEGVIRRIEDYVPRAWKIALESGDPPAWWWREAYPVLLAASESVVDLSSGMAQARLGADMAATSAADAIDRQSLYAGVRILRAHSVEEAASMGAKVAGQASRDLQWTAGRALDAFRPPGRRMIRTPNSTACGFCRQIAGQTYRRIDDVSVHEYCRCGWDYLDADDPRNAPRPRPRQRGR